MLRGMVYYKQCQEPQSCSSGSCAVTGQDGSIPVLKAGDVSVLSWSSSVEAEPFPAPPRGRWDTVASLAIGRLLARPAEPGSCARRRARGEGLSLAAGHGTHGNLRALPRAPQGKGHQRCDCLEQGQHNERGGSGSFGTWTNSSSSLVTDHTPSNLNDTILVLHYILILTLFLHNSDI